MLRPRQINRASYTAKNALPGWFNAIGDEPAESRSVATVKDASSGPVAQLGARSVMLRIPLPEYADGTLYSDLTL